MEKVPAELERVILSRDEIEAMYLCDAENLSQEEAGQRMGISRGTVQRLLAQGRKKTVEAIVLGKAFSIAGGQQK